MVYCNKFLRIKHDSQIFFMLKYSYNFQYFRTFFVFSFKGTFQFFTKVNFMILFKIQCFRYLSYTLTACKAEWNSICVGVYVCVHNSFSTLRKPHIILCLPKLTQHSINSVEKIKTLIHSIKYIFVYTSSELHN